MKTIVKVVLLSMLLMATTCPRKTQTLMAENATTQDFFVLDKNIFNGENPSQSPEKLYGDRLYTYLVPGGGSLERDFFDDMQSYVQGNNYVFYIIKEEYSDVPNGKIRETKLYDSIVVPYKKSKSGGVHLKIKPDKNGGFMYTSKTK